MASDGMRREKAFGEKEAPCSHESNFKWTEQKSDCNATWDVSLYVVTWNMNGKVPCNDLITLLGKNRSESFDLYVVGLQEVPRGDMASIFQKALGHSHILVGSAVMQSLQLFIFGRKACLPFITDVRLEKIGGGGLGGIVGRQKGAVAIAFNFMQTYFLFISCHLAPHEGNVEERNCQYRRICRTTFSNPREKMQSSCLHSPSRLIKLWRRRRKGTINPSSVEKCDVVVWLGDLNYRIERSRSSVGFLVNQNKQKLLRDSDQLSREAERGEIFQGFCEGPLSFRPTYKYDIGTDDYDTSAKERVPSWTDRILYKTNPSTKIKAHVEDYDCIDSIRVSDHRPVKALLYIKLQRPLASQEDG